MDTESKLKIFLRINIGFRSLLLLFVYILCTAKVAEGICVEPCLYFANATSLKRVQVQASSGQVTQETKVETIYNNKEQFIGPIALDHAGKRIFWSDTTTRSIYKSHLNGTGVQQVIKYGIGLCEGIAYDWSTDNIYWTDSLHDWIEVASSDGKNRMVVINGSMHIPRGIAVTPFDSYVFWSDFGKIPRIERATLDGKNRRAIVTNNLVWPNDLAIDFSAKRVYWIDAYRDKIESTDYSGGGRIVHTDVSYQGRIQMHPYSMTIFFQHSLAYFTDWYRSLVLYQAMRSGTIVPHVAADGPTMVRKIGQVRLMHTTNQPPSTSQCLTNRDICSHICLRNTAGNYSCACPTGMRLTQQGGRCQKDDLDYQAFLLDGKDNGSKIFHISKFVSQPQYVFDTLNLPTSGLPVGIDFDPMNGVLYWSDVALDKIFKMSINGSGYKAVADRNLRTPEGVALDPVSNLLYFADFAKETIEVVSLAGSWRKVLINSDLVNPRDIQLYHEKGLMFFSDWGKRTPKIESAFLDGTGRNRLITSSIHTPSGLALDKNENRIYWCDMKLDRIESSNFDGSDRRVLFDHFGYAPYVPIDTITGEIQAPFGLALFRERIYWTDWKTKSVYSADKRTGGKISLISAGFRKPMQIHVYSNKSKKEFKKKYFFSHARSSSLVKFTCFTTTCNLQVTEEPAMCPPGFKQTKLGQTCTKCATNFGPFGRRCPCNDWMTCAHRAYLKSNCPVNRPFMNFKVRECVQVVNPGFCPAFQCGSEVKNQSSCVSDHDCLDSQKCCQTSCGKKCLNSSKTSVEHICQNKNGGCSHFCFRMPNGFKCGCPDAMILQSADNKTCIKQSGYCAQHKPCLNRGICMDNAIGSYNCTCQPGYRGERCQNLSVKCAPNSCENGGNCTVISNQIKCSCPPLFSGPKCKHSILCSSYPCSNNGTCLPTAGGYRCECRLPFTGKHCDAHTACSPNPCSNNGTCLATAGGYRCECRLPFTGKHCDAHTACSPNPCSNNGTCLATAGGYRCNCRLPFTGKHCEEHKACSPNPCSNNGTCLPTAGGYRCECRLPFTGKHCDAHTACSPNPCVNNGTCHIQSGNASCQCKTDFTGLRCESRVSCLKNLCKNNGTCVVRNGQEICVCQKDNTGQYCETWLGCSPNPCHNNGKCTVVGGQVKCYCMSEFTGARCDSKLICFSKPCLNGGTCNELNNDYSCTCPNGYRGKSCETPPPCMSKPCQNSGRCNPVGADGYECICTAGYLGRTCTKVNYCASNKCKNLAICVNGDFDYTCRCSQGFVGRYCDSVVDFCAGHSCKNGATCVKSNAGYTCQCPDDYRGIHCESKIDNCVGVTCKNSGTCVDGINAYHCNCSQYFTGLHCENVIDMCKNNVCLNNGKCEVKQPEGERKLPFICKCSANFTGSICQLSYANNLVQVHLSSILSNLPPILEIQQILANEYTAYCLVKNCAEKTVTARKKRDIQSPVTVSANDIIIPSGFPRSSAASETELRFAVSGKQNGAAFVLSSKVARDGFIESKAKIEKSLGVKVLSVKALSKTPSAKPAAGAKKLRGKSSKRGLAVGLVVAVLILVLVIILAFYYRKRKRRFDRSPKFGETSFDNIIYQSRSDVNEDGKVEIRNKKRTENQSNLQFQKMMYESNDLYGEGLKVDLSDSGYSAVDADMESKNGMAGVVNPYTELSEEEKAAHVERTNSSAVLMQDLPPVGLTSLEAVQIGFVHDKIAQKSPRRNEETKVKGTIVQVQSNGLTGYENPSYDFNRHGTDVGLITDTNTPIDNTTSEAEA